MDPSEHGLRAETLGNLYQREREFQEPGLEVTPCF